MDFVTSYIFVQWTSVSQNCIGMPHLSPGGESGNDDGAGGGGNGADCGADGGCNECRGGGGGNEY